MSDEPIDLAEQESAIRAVYHGPLEAFVDRRNAIVKQSRVSGKREDAARLKALRKPSRAAWALDNVVFEDPATIEQLTAAITAAQAAQSRGGVAVRAALENVRHAVRAVAHAAASVAQRAGYPVETTSLVAAVHAVIGDASAFADLRAGRLTDIPEGGGLDILTAVTVATPALPSIAAPGEQPQPVDAERAAAARAALQRAEEVLATARERLQAAERTVLNAQAKLAAAEQRLQRAREEADARRTEYDRARQDAESVARDFDAAERAVAAARASVI